MSGALVLFLGALRLTALQNHSYTQDDNYYELPRFWTHTGFCPAGHIDHHDITATLLSEATQMNLRYVAALPTGAITHVRIHWLLELVEFEQFTQSGLPIYDFTNLDTFLMDLDELNLYPVVEFMANLGDVFVKNPLRKAFLWEDFTFQVVKHYLNILGAAKVLRWKFESWNEPDLVNYNKLNFTVEEYLTYLVAIRRGLTAAGRRPANSLYFPLSGPAGLFKDKSKHPLCWTALEQCNEDIAHCPFQVLTYHRKGNGSASGIVDASSVLLKSIYLRYTALERMPISNDEADPIVGWSTPQSFHEDVRYAATLILTVFYHWHAKLKLNEFKNLYTISHDNAFLSYHPHEFSQRTLLAHFRMNNTNPVHSQFIQKPVYAALGMLSKVGPLAADIEIVQTVDGQEVQLLKTTVSDDTPLYFSWIFVVPDESADLHNITLERTLPFVLCAEEHYVYIVELLSQHLTNPVQIWRSYNTPAYPNATIREAMRRSQTPLLHDTGPLWTARIEIHAQYLRCPCVMLLRICTNLMPPLPRPKQLVITGVTHGEVLLAWTEIPNATSCLKTYEVWFNASITQEWICASKGWHLPFPSFQYAPTNGQVNGFYKIRGVDIFNKTSQYSEIVEYFEI